MTSVHLLPPTPTPSGPDKMPNPLVQYRPLHPTFGAEAVADFSSITPALITEIKSGLAKVPFNPRRAGISLLLAHELPPPELGGDTEFADTRSAYDALSEDRKAEIKDWVVCNSQLNCRRNANIDDNGRLNPLLDTDEFDPMKHRFGKHKLVQTHEPSGRTNLYIAAHAHHVEGMPLKEGQKQLHDLLMHAGKPEFTFRVQWKEVGDLVVWDNTCTLHRSVPGQYAGKYKRDLRRTTVHDMSSQAWGLNGEGATWRSGLD
ncbi:uncharacterized protein I206_101332 [Kwoniella pini CBS 10737]|uniref:TauD/TfdA-like domain-containing protein n=1 Tax=Kwoniella pini CBS 10737 TaxID=1296096 RepID=A0AAJ8KZM9_9TREE